MKVTFISTTKSPFDEMETPEQLIAYCARVSSSNQDNPEYEKLFQYLIDHKHWSPFEMVDMTVEIETTRAIAPQILRHRSFVFQEFCVSGDTEITFELPNGVRRGKRAAYRRTIEHLYRLQERGLKMPGHIRVFDEPSRTFVTAPIKEVFQTGMKPVFRLTLENGKTVVATKEHCFLTENGFETMEDALGLKLVGNSATWVNTETAFACNGVPAHQDVAWLSNAKKQSIMDRTGLQGIADAAEVTTHTIRKWLKIHQIQFTKKEVASYSQIWNKGARWTHRRHTIETIEKMRKSARRGRDSNLWKGGVARPERLAIADWCNANRSEFLKLAQYSCSRCGGHDRLELHHRHPVAERPDLAKEKSNIEVLCHDCHGETHRISGHAKLWRERSHGNTLTIHWSKVRSVEYAGERMTYDLEVAHESHNYVANGIVTHNSQRYAKAQGFEYYPPRMEDSKNRQNSIDPSELEEDDDYDAMAIEEEFLLMQEEVHATASRLYEHALSLGIAKECARVLLPLGTKTKLYMKGSVRSWIHYLEVRTEAGAQKEHRDIAEEIKKIFIEQFPVISKALRWV